MNEHLDFNGQGDSKQKINSAEARNEPPVDYLPDVASKASVSVPKRIVAWLLIAVILGTGIIAFLYNFVLFPSVYEGLMRALEPKFELGLVYDLENMADGGRIELYADGLADSRVFGSSLSATLDYDCDDLLLAFDLTSENLTAGAFLSEEHAALKLGGVNGDGYIGIGLENADNALDSSVFAPDSGSDFALSEENFDRLKELLGSIGEDNSDELKRHISVLCLELHGVFGESAVSEYETVYRFWSVESKRFGRTKIYSFDSAEAADLMRRLSDAIANADGKVAEAKTALEAALPTVDFGLAAEELEATASELESEDRQYNIAFTYVGRALSLLDVKISDSDSELSLSVDFGKNPSRDTDITASLRLSEHYKSGGYVETYSSLLWRCKKHSDFGAYLETDSRIYDGVREEPAVINSKKTYANGVFGDGTLKLAFGTENYFEHNGRVQEDSSSEYECLLGLIDTKKRLELSTDSITLTRDGVSEEQSLPEEMRLVLSEPRDISAPDYDDILRLDESEIKTLIEEAISAIMALF